MNGSIDFPWAVLRMVGVLGLLLVLIFLIFKFLIPLLMKRGGFSSKQNGLISVLQRFALEPRKNLYLLKVAQKTILVGTTDQSIHLITEVSEKRCEHLNEEF